MALSEFKNFHQNELDEPVGSGGETVAIVRRKIQLPLGSNESARDEFLRDHWRRKNNFSRFKRL